MRSDWRGWVLLDRDAKLVAYNEDVYRGVSPRKALTSSRQRNLLLPHLTEMLRGGPSTTYKDHTIDSEHSHTVVHILRAPRSGEIVGALGALYCDGAVPPVKPLVGCWEWVVPPGESLSTAQSYWDRGQYELYDVEPAPSSTSGSAFLPPEWFFRVVAPRDAPRLHAMIDKGISMVTRELHTIIYQVTAAHGTDREYTQYLRLVGRAGRDDDGKVRLTGMSHEAVGRVEEWTPGLDDEISSTDILAAAFRVTTSALFLIDVDSGQLILAADNGWSRANIAPPVSASVRDVIAVDSLGPLMDHLRLVTTGRRSERDTCDAEISTIDGEYRRFTARATAVRTVDGTSSYAMVELTPSSEI